MGPENSLEHLSHISTLWTLVHEAHQGAPQAVTQAQHVLLERYSGAVHRYLCGALRNAEAADELFQEFCLRFLRGDFRRASPERGRFRDYVKTALFHLVVDHRKQKQPASMDLPEPAWTPPLLTEADQAFLESWREALLDRAWWGLAEIERTTGQPVHSVLRLRTDQPLLTSEALAEQLGARRGKSYSVHAVRQALHRAREKFTDLLLDEVAQSLEDPSADALEQELLDLGLLDYCRGALQRRRQGRAPG
jgi:RNA polymerase sigma-70 factor (ECF subfamily)